MEYISTYLRKQARKHEDEEFWTETVTKPNGEKDTILLSLPTLLLASADEIEMLRKKVKELDEIEILRRKVKELENKILKSSTQ